ncbi:zinc finger CCCH domain-containing protein 55-like [Pyrus ussuriensis x Pyrus communis]|uniref:Zinc finger CCCH domain-containing protein 55-like n=1 Tax=Pyrus ussuriensis x Pyrus communis TaxID=2448454 RepID=A0A5N5GIG9_9ROSA|nr:zinc finger CCCH domain-containing protein 55-like [Pyrus ussuriensis x Pyrus communis]
MGSYELTNVLFSKIKTLDPENAIKIMGYLLIQDLAEKDLIRLAYGPESLLHSLILRAKIQLGLSSNTSSASSTPSSPSPLNPIARPTNANPFSQSSPRTPNGFDFGNNSSSPSSNSWSLSGFPNNSINPKASPLLSHDNIRAGSFSVPVHSHQFSKDGGGGGGGDGWPGSDLIDEHQLSEYLSFLNESSSSSRPGDFINPRFELGPGVPDWVHSVNNGDTHFHKRSYSASDACLGSEDPALGVGFKPCLYFARGFCKNGSNCKFVHGGFADSLDAPGAIVGSPSNLTGFEQQEEMLRLKVEQQRLAAASQFMAGGSPSSYNKYMNFLLQQQNDPQRFAAMMMGEELFKFGRCRPDRNELLAMASVEKANSASRQIYLTFPAESTFRDEDVSEYFSSKFGPVQDVRIPYQQKRMFGFVTFVFPETVRLILSKGNPHFICDSRVLVKPYKEKGKILDKRQQQQQHLERGEFSSCLSPGSLDSRDAYDLPLGGRMFYSTQDVLLRRKLEEQAELQQAIELQGRRLMSLQLPDWKNERLTHHHRSLSVGAHGPLLSPHSHAQINQNILPFDSMEQEVAEGHSDIRADLISVTGAIAEQQSQKEDNLAFIHNNGNGNGKEKELVSNLDAPNLHKSAEQVLPDSLFACTKSAGDHHLSELSTAVPEVNDTAITTENNTLSSVNSAGFIASH